MHILDRICAEHNIHHKLTPPSTPQINGKVERSQRIDEEEFYRIERFKNSQSLRNNFLNWIHRYNHQRPRGGINMQTPAQKLYWKLNQHLPRVIEKLAV
jgi:transposase InsO family protein